MFEVLTFILQYFFFFFYIYTLPSHPGPLWPVLFENYVTATKSYKKGIL